MFDSEIILEDKIHSRTVLSKKLFFQLGIMILFETEWTLHIRIFNHRNECILCTFISSTFFEFLDFYWIKHFCLCRRRLCICTFCWSNTSLRFDKLFELWQIRLELYHLCLYKKLIIRFATHFRIFHFKD